MYTSQSEDGNCSKCGDLFCMSDCDQYIIIDWAHNRITNETFKTFDDGWDYILEHLATTEEDCGEYVVILQSQF